MPPVSQAQRRWAYWVLNNSRSKKLKKVAKDFIGHGVTDLPEKVEDGKAVEKSLSEEKAEVKGLPPEPGTAPIPEGHVRLYHQTQPEHIESIRKDGIQRSRAKGIEGPKAIYADEKGFYGNPADHTTVEFHVPMAQFRKPFVHAESVAPASIVAIHEPWHGHARYLHENSLQETLQGGFDHLLNEPDYGPAIKHLKAHYGQPMEKALRLTAHQPKPIQAGAYSQVPHNWHHEGTVANPLNEHQRVVTSGEATGVYRLKEDPMRINHYHVQDVRAVTRGGGRAAMEHLTRTADHHGVSLQLVAEPLNPGGGEGKKLTRRELRNWYQGFGFRPKQGDSMVRTPNKMEKSMDAKKIAQPMPKLTPEMRAKRAAGRKERGQMRRVALGYIRASHQEEDPSDRGYYEDRYHDEMTYVDEHLAEDRAAMRQENRAMTRMKKSSPALYNLYGRLEKSLAEQLEKSQLNLFQDQPAAEGPVHTTKHPNFTVYSQLHNPDEISGHVKNTEGHSMSFTLYRNERFRDTWSPELGIRSKFPLGKTPMKAVVDHLRKYHPEIINIKRLDVARGNPKGEVKEFRRS